MHELLRGLKSKERKPIALFLESLEREPRQTGDYQEKDGTLRDIEIKIVGKWSIAYWVDHPVCEVRLSISSSPTARNSRRIPSHERGRSSGHSSIIGPVGPLYRNLIAQRDHGRS